MIFTKPSPWTGLGQCIAFLSVCESVCNHFSPYPPPYIELEEGSAWTCVGGAP